MITLEVEVSILAKLPSLVQAAIKKLERGGVVVTKIEKFANRTIVLGTVRVASTVRRQS